MPPLVGPRMNHPRHIGSELPSHPLEPLRLEICLLGPFISFLYWALLVSPLATVPTLASKVRIICLGISFHFTINFLVPFCL